MDVAVSFSRGIEAQPTVQVIHAAGFHQQRPACTYQGVGRDQQCLGPPLVIDALHLPNLTQVHGHIAHARGGHDPRVEAVATVDGVTICSSGDRVIARAAVDGAAVYRVVIEPNGFAQ